jgi:group I intron endonuclease
MNSGIYQIWIGDHYYFGSTNDFEKRKNRHLSGLKKGNHKNPIMQNAYNKYQTFDFDIILTCDVDSLEANEQAYIDTHYGLSKCININPSSSRPPVVKKGHKSRPKKIIVNGVVYPSVTEASKQLGRSIGILSQWAVGKRNSREKWEVRYAD